MYTYVKINQAVPLRFVPFAVCKLNLNKVILYNDYVKTKREWYGNIDEGTTDFSWENEMHT